MRHVFRILAVCTAVAALCPNAAAASADLSVSISGQRDTSAGEFFAVTVAVMNSGPDVASGPVASITFDPSSAIMNVSCGWGNAVCSAANDVYSLALGDLAAGRIAYVVVSGQVAETAAGSVSLIAAVSAGGGDPDTTNNRATASFQVLPPVADLTVGFGRFGGGYYDTAVVTPGASVSLTLAIGNAGPAVVSAATVDIVSPWPATACTAQGGSCQINAGQAQARFASLEPGAFGIPITVTIAVPSDVAAGSEVTGSVQVRSANPDRSPAGARFAFRVDAPTSAALAVSSTKLDFGSVPFGYNGPTRQVTVTNTSSSAVTLEVPFATSEFFASADTCFGYVAPDAVGKTTLAPGASCTTDVTVNPYALGAHAGRLVYTQLDPPGQVTVELDAVALGLLLSANEMIDFGLVPIASGSPTAVYLTNVAPRPLNVSGIVVAGAEFTATNDCPPALPPRSSNFSGPACAVTITFSPVVAGSAAGQLTITDDDAVPTTVIQLRGRGAALTLALDGRPPSVNVGPLDFDTHVLDIPVSKPMTLTNVSRGVVHAPRVTVSGDQDFTVRNNCPASLLPGASCEMDAVFTPNRLGARSGTVAFLDRDTGVPQSVSLTGSGLGIGARKRLYLHYDYMVVSDQGGTCTPAPNPGFTPTSPDCDDGQYCIQNICRGHSHEPPKAAIDAVVAAFARRGVELKIDPVSTAIPETRYLEMDSPSVGCPGVNIPGLSEKSAYFFDLKAKYYKPASPKKQEHYAVFGHYGYTPFFGCQFATGESHSIPAYDFFVTLGSLFDFDFSSEGPELLRNAAAGTLMHEFGHNLGLDHPSPNYNPAQFSVMNYAYQFGIPMADRPGSTLIDPERTLIDYSSQVLPAGGNTPGRLDATDLDEPAGLGAGDAKVLYFKNGQFNSDVAPAEGPVDWDGDGIANNLDAADPWLFWLTSDPFGPPVTVGAGFDDWSYLFTGDPHVGQPGQNPDHRPVTHGPQEPEQTIEQAMARHVLLQARAVEIAVQPGCPLSEPPVAAGAAGLVRVAILGSRTFNVADVDPSSLAAHGARASSVEVRDVNGDGIADLVATFDSSQLELHRDARRLRVTGSLHNSRLFAGDAAVVVGSSVRDVPPSCRP